MASTSRRDRDRVEWHAARLELARELPCARLVLVEHQEPHVPPARPERRQDRKQVALRAGDAGDLLQVEDERAAAVARHGLMLEGGEVFKRVFGVAAAGVALVAVLSSASSSSTREGAGAVAWHAQRAPFALVVTAKGRTVLAEAASASAGSLAYRLADGTEHATTTLIRQGPAPGGGTRYVVATDEPGRTAIVTVRATAQGLSVDFKLQPATGISETHEEFRSAASEHFLGGGENGEHVDMAGQVVPIAVNYGCEYVATPYYASSAGYGVYVPGTARGRLAFPANGGTPSSCGDHDLAGCGLAPVVGETQVCMQSNELKYDVFVGSFAEISRAYVDTTGHAIMPPVSEFALIKWRDVVSKRSDIHHRCHRAPEAAHSDRLGAARQPLGVGVRRPLQFDPSRVGNPATLIRQVHALGVKFMLWVSPMADLPRGVSSEAAPAAGAGEGYPTINFESAPAVATYQSRLRKLIALGVDGFKADRGADFDVGSDPQPVPGRVRPGRDADDPRRRGDLPERIRRLPGDHSRHLGGRPARGLHRPPAGGTDGADSRHERLPDLGLGHGRLRECGRDVGCLPALGSTVGRFPVFEVGGEGPNATFWQWGAQVDGLFRESAVLHYELFPYLYGLAQNATAGVPILRPLGYEFPAEAGAWGSNLELMVGPSLLAAP